MSDQKLPPQDALAELLVEVRRLIRDLRGQLPPPVSGTVDTVLCPVCRFVMHTADLRVSGGKCPCGYKFLGH